MSVDARFYSLLLNWRIYISSIETLALLLAACTVQVLLDGDTTSLLAHL